MHKSRTTEQIIESGWMSYKEIGNTLTNSLPNYGEIIIGAILKKYRLFKYIHSFLMGLSLVAAGCSTILTAVFLSNILPSSFTDDESNAWFFVLSALLSAGVSLISGLLNFFIVKDKIRTLFVQKNHIFLEIIKYQNEMTDNYKGKLKHFNHFNEIQKIIGSSVAKAGKHSKGVKNARKSK